jgi:hypothetical protein
MLGGGVEAATEAVAPALELGCGGLTDGEGVGVIARGSALGRAGSVSLAA